MAWGRMGPKMKPGQIFHLGTMKQRLVENYERENEFVRTRKLPVALVDAGIPARMPHPTDTRLDETLGIPLAIADNARRHSAACLEYVGSFYAGILPTTPTPEKEAPAPTTTMPVRRVTTISIAREEQVEAEAAMEEDDEVFNNVFCTTPLKTSPTRPQYSSSKRSKARSVIFTDPQLDEVWNRRVGPGIRVVPKPQTKTKTRSLTRSMRALSCTDNTAVSFGRSEVRSLKRKRSSGGPSTSTPVKPMSPAPVTPGAWMETTTAAPFDMPGTCSAQRKKAPATALKIVKSRKRMKLTHNMTEMELEKMSGTRRRLFEDVHVIHPTCRYS